MQLCSNIDKVIKVLKNINFLKCNRLNINLKIVSQIWLEGSLVINPDKHR